MRMLRLLLQRGRCVGAVTPGICACAVRPKVAQRVGEGCGVLS